MLLIAGDPSSEAAVDDELLCQTLIDLLDNALKYATKSVTVILYMDASHSLIDNEDDGPASRNISVSGCCSASRGVIVRAHEVMRLAMVSVLDSRLPRRSPDCKAV